MPKIICPTCRQDFFVIKSGRNHTGSQRYRCQKCRLYFTPEPLLHGYEPSVREQAMALARQGHGYRAIGRQLGINHQTIGNWLSGTNPETTLANQIVPAETKPTEGELSTLPVTDPPKLVTIREVAKQAGVAISTVSYVLNGYERRVKAATSERVLEVVKQLNYRPNAIARSMVKRKTATIGVIVAGLENPVIIAVTEGVAEVLRANGYHMVLASAPDFASELEAVETLRSQRVDGFIFMSRTVELPDEHLSGLKADNLPLVVINRSLTDTEISLVQFDDLGAAYLATRHLIELGHRRIGIISGPIHNEPAWQGAIARFQGWQKALAETYLPVVPEWVQVSDYTLEGGYQATGQLLRTVSELPSALFVANHSLAVGALKALNIAGVDVPQTIAVTAVGDAPFSAYTVPALTTVAMPLAEAGRIATTILVNWIKTGQPPAPQKILLHGTLQVRDSALSRQKKL
jgi:LacI family transcriptional regulator